MGFWGDVDRKNGPNRAAGVGLSIPGELPEHPLWGPHSMVLALGEGTGAAPAYRMKPGREKVGAKRPTPPHEDPVYRPAGEPSDHEGRGTEMTSWIHWAAPRDPTVKLGVFRKSAGREA